MSGLHEAFDEIVADVPAYGDLDRAIEQADRERRRRHGMVAGLAAAAAVIAVVVGVLALTLGGSDPRQPIGPSTPAPTPTEETTQTTEPANAMVNGRIRDIEEHLARVRPACDDCYVEGRAFDQESGTLLVASSRSVAAGPVGLSVVGADGLLADLSCPGDFACRKDRGGAETLGPGADELTVSSSHQEVQVIGYDGAVRRTLDLSAVLDESSEVAELAWSPDGSRLAVRTSEFSSGLISHIWLVDDDGGDAQRVHTASYTGPLNGKAPLGYIWSLAWSPDGRRLGFIEEHARLGGSEESLSIQAVSLLLPGPGQQGPGRTTTLYDYATRPFDYAAFLWSPDGTRVAVRIPDYALELSPEDESVLAQHPFECQMSSDRCFPLIWPARQP